MAYANAATVEELHARINRRLKLEGANTAGLEPAALDEALNQAAREVAGELARLEAADLLVSKTYPVNPGDASLALPDGSEAAYPPVLKIVGADWQLAAGLDAAPVEIVDRRTYVQQPAYCAAGAYALAHEGLLLRWLSVTGAPTAGLLTLRYLAALPLVARSGSGAASKPYELLPAVWSDIIVDLATAALVPADKAAAARYLASGQAGLAREAVAVIGYVHTRPRQIRRV